MSTASTTTTASPAKLRRGPRSVFIAAWAIPIMVLGQFAMLAVIPVAIVLIGTLRSASIRALRWWVGLLTLAYATPLALYAFNPDRAQSLSKDIDPIFVAAIVVTSAIVLLKLHTNRKR
jgi:hypothetical protein